MALSMCMTFNLSFEEGLPLEWDEHTFSLAVQHTGLRLGLWQALVWSELQLFKLLRWGFKDYLLSVIC